MTSSGGWRCDGGHPDRVLTGTASGSVFWLKGTAFMDAEVSIESYSIPPRLLPVSAAAAAAAAAAAVETPDVMVLFPACGFGVNDKNVI